MSVNNQEDDALKVDLLYDGDDYDPEEMVNVVPVPDFDDEGLRSEIEKEKMMFDVKDENLGKLGEALEEPGLSCLYSRYEKEKNEKDKKLYFNNRRYRRMEKRKVPPKGAWSERELRTVPLTLKERQKAPFFFFFCSQFCDGLLYPPYAIYYVLKHCLWRFVVVDLIVYFIGFVAYVGILYLIAWWLIGLLGGELQLSDDQKQQWILILFEGFLYLLLLTANTGINWINYFFNMTKRKVSNYTEHIMKGTKMNKCCCYSITKGESRGNMIEYFVGIVVDNLTIIGIKFVLFTLIVPFIVSVLNEIGAPAVGTILNVVLSVLMCLFDNALGSFTIPLNRKRYRYRERIWFCLCYLPLMLGFGFSVLILDIFPVVNIFFILCCDYVAGTRCFLHLEYRCGPHKEYYTTIPRIVYQTTVLNPADSTKPVLIQQAGEEAKNIVITKDTVDTMIKPEDRKSKRWNNELGLVDGGEGEIKDDDGEDLSSLKDFQIFPGGVVEEELVEGEKRQSIDITMKERLLGVEYQDLELEENEDEAEQQDPIGEDSKRDDSEDTDSDDDNIDLITTI